ncbi:MAG TPA: response regulator [bacterium]|nr:response regulator [bacterium]HOL47598.1 response regulator [bacterium]HPQ18719.1 response regulator [bacterium]
MFSKKVLVISPNKTISEYIETLATEIKENTKFLLNTEDITSVIDNFQPDIIFMYINLKNKENEDIYTIIRKKSRYTNIPILFYSFNSIPTDIMEMDNSISYIRLPTTNEQLIMEFEKLLFNKKFILIVDDSKTIHTQLRQILMENNFNVIEAYNGKEALEILERKKPDLILSDIEMPEMDGYEFCKRVKTNPKTENIPFVILSSLTGGLNIDRGFDAGANDYLTKPIDNEELISRINALITETTHYTREKVLVVDDSKTIRNIMIQGFEQQGFRVFYAVNGKDGLEKAREIEPDIITTDYDMPIMNGWDFCQALRKDKKLKDIPVIMLTSRDSKSDKAKSAGTGVKAYLTKPFTIDKLIVIVERLLAEKKMQKEREILKFYVSDAALEDAKLRSKDKELMYQMRAKEAYVTVMFTDLAGFTTTCEKLPAQELLSLLNEYFDIMCQILKNHNAIIDKFIGDAIMAIFGNPKEGQLDAVKAGINMLNALKEFNETQTNKLNMRIGVNSGNLYMGDLGSKYYRRDFTVIGDNVNLASRLEGVGKVYGINFVISASTRDGINSDEIVFRKLDKIKVKGKNEPVVIYEVVGYKKDVDVNLIIEFEKGLDAYFNQDWNTAIKIFQNILKNKNDGPSAVYLERCKYYKKKPPGAGWDGVYTMTSK